MWEYFDSLEKFYIIVVLLYIPIMLFGLIASAAVKSTFRKYQQVPTVARRTAAEICRHMLDTNGLQYVQIMRVAGTLTDHYDPTNQTIALSDSVYSSSSVGAIGVACHEAGHAVQHARNYAFSSLRSALVPIVNFSNRLIFPLFIIGLLIGVFGTMLPFPLGKILIILAVVLFGMSMLFSLVTLPTEFNASRRAQIYLRECGMFSGDEIKGSRKVLTAAAMTYVAAFLMSTVQFLYYLIRLMLIMRRK